MLIFFIVITQSFFVRTVEIGGYKAIPETQLRQCLHEAGIHEGAFIPKIDWDGAQNLIYDTFPQITWPVSYTHLDVYKRQAGGGHCGRNR